MTTLWIGSAVLVAAGFLTVLVRSWQRRSRLDDLGAVSHQWISEQRLGQQGQDPRR